MSDCAIISNRFTENFTLNCSLINRTQAELGQNLSISKGLFFWKLNCSQIVLMGWKISASITSLKVREEWKFSHSETER